MESASSNPHPSPIAAPRSSVSAHPGHASARCDDLKAAMDSLDAHLPIDPSGMTALHADVAARLRRVCADMPSAAFDELVRDICAMKRRWDLQARAPTQPYRMPTTRGG